MLRLKVTLKPKTEAPLNLNYKSKLQRLCNKIIRFNPNRGTELVKSEKNREKLFFSPLFCCKYEVKDETIIFQDNISWYITTLSYDLILHLIQGLHNMDAVKIGKIEFEVMGLEINEVAEAKIKRNNVVANKNIEIFENIESIDIMEDIEYSSII